MLGLGSGTRLPFPLGTASRPLPSGNSAFGTPARSLTRTPYTLSSPTHARAHAIPKPLWPLQWSGSPRRSCGPTRAVVPLTAYAELVGDTKEALEPLSLLVTVAVHPWQALNEVGFGQVRGAAGGGT